MCSPIAKDAVAAGLGAFRTWRDCSFLSNTKSSISEPSLPTACARTPAILGVKSFLVISGIYFKISLKKHPY